MPLAAAFALAAFSAQAADLYAPSAKDAPMFAVANWAGFYAGVNGGYGWDSTSSTLIASAFQPGDLAPTVRSASFTPDGGFGGGQIGYNVQRERVVFGIEADIQGADITGNKHVQAANPGSWVTTDAWAGTNLDWFGTVRGRLGYSFGGTILYATGGFAFGGVKDSLHQSVVSTDTDPATTDSNAASRSATLTGYVIGGGVETKLTPSWSIKAEYQYIDLGSTNVLTTANSIGYSCSGPFLPPCADTGGASAKIDHAYNTVRAGLNYKINQPYEPLK
ncbi:MAG: outer membrane protein [Rhodomicrobium sp.]